MEELIKVKTQGDTQVVSARELYKGLEIAQRFSRWVSNNWDMFEEGIDYVPCTLSTQQNQYGGIKELDDYTITIDMAKQLAMMVRSEKGKQYRQYFLELERKWNDPQEVVKRGYAILQNENKQLKIENEVLKPKAEKYDRYLSNKGLITTTEVAKEYGMSGRELNEFLHGKGIIYKRGDKWFVYQKYANDALAGYEIYMPRDDKEVRRTLKWTTKGVQFIRDLLDVEGIKPVLERPQQLTMQEEYNGEWYTASSIVYYLGLSEEYIVEVGKIANKLHLKPMFTDCNQYCRKTLDTNGFPRWEYTRLGAGVIEKELYKLAG